MDSNLDAELVRLAERLEAEAKYERRMPAAMSAHLLCDAAEEIAAELRALALRSKDTPDGQ